MQVRIEEVSPVEKKLLVEVPWDTVSTRLGDAYKELGKGAQVKGFRPGKVPRGVLEQMYAPRIHAEVTVQLVRESFYQAMSQHKIAAVTEPRIEEASPIKKGQPLTFSAIVEVRSEIDPKDYIGLPVERRKLAVPEEAVDRALEQLRKEHTELKPIEGREDTAAGDIVAVSITGKIGMHDVNQPRYVIDLDDSEREPVPGLRQALTGIPLSTKDRALELPIGADHPDESIRGETARLTVSVLEARAKEVPALDDEFAKDTGRAEDLAGLRAKVRADIEAHETEHIERECRDAALKELVLRNQIPVASSLIERAVELQWNRLRSMLGMKAGQGGELSAEMREKMRPAGADEVRGQLLLEAIGEKEQVLVPEEDVERHVANAAQQRRIAPQKLRAEWEKDGKLDSVRWSLRQEKVLAFLVTKAQITEVEKASPHELHDGAHHAE